MQAVRLCHGFPGPVLVAGRSGTPEGSRDRIWGNIRAILGLCGDNGKENGNYYLGFRVSGP